HRLASPGLAGEEHLEARVARDRPLVAPLGKDEIAVPDVRGDRSQELLLALRHDEAVPAERRLEPPWELAQPRARGLARAGAEGGGPSGPATTTGSRLFVASSVRSLPTTSGRPGSKDGRGTRRSRPPAGSVSRLLPSR